MMYVRLYILLRIMIGAIVNNRQIFRKYAQYLGKQAIPFIKLDEDYGSDILYTKDDNENIEKTFINYKDK